MEDSAFASHLSTPSALENNTGLKRKDTDKYYTKPSIAKECLERFYSLVSIHDNDIVIEPSAGAGVFYFLLKNKYPNTQGYDILPDHEEIMKQDYLDLEIPQKLNNSPSVGPSVLVPWHAASAADDQKIHVIGNPPFGRQSSLAKKFIKKSTLFCDTIGFILPKSFKKDSFQSVFPLHFHLIDCVDLPENSFEVSGMTHDVPCCFQIWIKKDYEREKKPKNKPVGYTFVKKSENPDFSFRRVGVYAGKLNKECKDKSEQSHYFIKVTSGSVDAFESLYNEKIKFDHNNSVGAKSISKNELIDKLNMMMTDE
jgi:predicted RNA methylase